MRKVVIEVTGGVAEVTECPDDVEVEIIDHDNEGSDPAFVCPECCGKMVIVEDYTVPRCEQCGYTDGDDVCDGCVDDCNYCEYAPTDADVCPECGGVPSVDENGNPFCREREPIENPCEGCKENCNYCKHAGADPDACPKCGAELSVDEYGIILCTECDYIKE